MRLWLIMKMVPTLVAAIVGASIALTHHASAAGIHTTSVCCTSPVPVHSPHPTQNLIIQPMGDSITIGYQSTVGNGYRHFLAPMITAKTTAWNYVGEFTSAAGPYEAIGGNTINNLASRTPNCLFSNTGNGNVNLELVDLGTNDAYQGRTTAQMLQDMSVLLDDLLGFSSSMRVVLAQITITAVDSANQQKQEIMFDASLPNLVTQKNTEWGSNRVVLADMRGAELSTDGTHPDDTGYQYMATQFFNAINTAGWLG